MKKNALITGGNSGIGFATAKLLKNNGYDVVILGRDSKRVMEAAGELGVEFFIADLATEIKSTLHSIADLFPNGLDVLINNAAIAHYVPLEHITDSNFLEFYNTNVRGPLLLIQTLLPALEKRKGAVTNISSAVVSNPQPNASLYAGTKGAIESLSRCLARELANKKIRVNVVSPGAVETPIINKMCSTPEEISAIKARVEANIPLGRFGTPKEVAKVVLAQIESSYVTGAVWRVDGGVT